MFGKGAAASGFAAPEVTGNTVDFPPMTLRSDNLLAVAGKKDTPVEITLKHHPVADYKTVLAWELRSLNMDAQQSGTIDPGQTGVLRFTPEEDATYLVGLSAGGCAYSIRQSNAPLAILTGDGASFIREAKPLYFFVPANTGTFTVTARGGGSETVRINILAPDGTTAATGQTTPANSRVSIKARAEGNTGEVWSLEAVHADEGVIEDYSITLSENIPPVLAFVPEYTFKTKQ